MQINTIVFLLAGLLHLSVLITGWTLSIGTYEVPIIINGIAAIVLFSIAYENYKTKK